jgi:dihydroorotase
MRTLLKSVTVIDPEGPYHNQVVDLLIDQGIIQNIGESIDDDKAECIQMTNAHISLGWFDPSVSLGEPGFEERETLDNGSLVAATSGYTAIGIQPNTNPVTQSKAAVNFVKSKENIVNLLPIGALTVDNKGEDICELFDMHNSGAIAFGDYKTSIKDPNVLKLALEYTQSFSGIICSFPMDSNLGKNGMINESPQSVQLGLKGIPKLSEHLQIKRDLSILKYTGGRLHIPTISTAESVTLIRDAKKQGMAVSCSVAIHNLVLTDEILESFDTDHKLLPPLREKEDQKALLNGLIDGTIDGVTSDHNPIDIEHKKVEFDHAMFGSIGLEHTFGTLLKRIDLVSTIKALTGLRQCFDLETGHITNGSPANLTVFNPDPVGIVTLDEGHSKSKNAALKGCETKGKVLGIINGDKQLWNEQ